MKSLLLAVTAASALLLADTNSAQAGNFDFQLFIGNTNFARPPVQPLPRGFNNFSPRGINPSLMPHGHIHGGVNPRIQPNLRGGVAPRHSIHQQYIPGRWENCSRGRVWVPGQIQIHQGGYFSPHR